MGSAGSDLRAKYMDWCSARIAERFLELSPEEIYALARPPEETAPGRFASGSEATYRELVQRATEALLEQVQLPSFEAWSRAYGAEPERYDAELLGFWREANGGSSDPA